MSIPLTTKLTLKRIVEAVQDGSLPDNGFGEPPPKMSSESKKKLMELSAMYEKFGECLKNEESLMNAAKGITELCELAESYALNECGEWFQQEIVKKDMQGLKKRVSEFQKIVKETYARMQQAGVAYQDIGHVLGRYYDLNGGGQGQDQQRPGPQTLQQESKKKNICKKCKRPFASSHPDDAFCGKCAPGGEEPDYDPYQDSDIKKKVTPLNEGKRICSWCKKDMGDWSGEGDARGMCPDCRAIWKRSIPTKTPPDSTSSQTRKKVTEGLEILCGWCGKGLGNSTDGGQSHGICQSCKANVLAGKETPEMEAYRKAKTAHLHKPPQNEGRCEDYPCCGHEVGGCPDRDKQGNETYRCASCGRRLPPMSPSSLCSKCIGRLHRSVEDDPTGQDMDDFDGGRGGY